MRRDILIEALNDTLAVDTFKDYCVNGLQIEGKQSVERVAAAVSITQDVIERAIEWEADLLLVHHGFFWTQSPQSLLGYRRARMASILAAELNVAAYHLPLDAHPKVGNNACLARAMELQDVQPFAPVNGVPVGCWGRMPRALPAEEVRSMILTLCGGLTAAFLHGPKLVETVGIVSGGAARMVEEAHKARLDLYLTGEAQEDSMAVSQELGVHFVAAGHHRTEVFGVREHIAAEYGLEVRFFEVSNPI